MRGSRSQVRKKGRRKGRLKPIEKIESGCEKEGKIKGWREGREKGKEVAVREGRKRDERAD